MTYLTDSQVADLFNVSVRTIQRVVARLPAGTVLTVGRLRRWPADRARLEELLALATPASSTTPARPRRASRESNSVAKERKHG